MLVLAGGAAAATVAIVAVGSAQAVSDRYARLLAPSGRCGAVADALRLDQAAAEQAMLCLTNYARVESGLRPLSANALLNQAGQAKLEANVACGQFSHTPCGKPYESVFATYLDGAKGYETGENIAWGSGPYGTPRQTMSLWLHSPHHRANILDRRFHDLGVGYLPQPSFLGYEHVTLWSQEFGSRNTRSLSSFAGAGGCRLAAARRVLASAMRLQRFLGIARGCGWWSLVIGRPHSPEPATGVRQKTAVQMLAELEPNRRGYVSRITRR